jgi:catechol 2,3-dioxygenase-like lactoylglutathione lyase family enzyme
MVLEPAEVMAFVPVREVARAASFYADVLGCAVGNVDDFGAMLTFGPTRLRLARVDDTEPPPYTALGFVVPAIAEAVRTLRAAGVEFRHYEGMGQDELGIWVAPSGDQVAWFADSEGNTLSLTQEGAFNLGE